MAQSRHLPVIPASFFGIVLGLGGLGGSWRVAHRVWGVPKEIGEALMIAAVVVWLILATLYVLKWVYARPAAKAELGHPIQCCFIGLGGVTTMVVAGAVLPYSRMAAIVIFAIGIVLTIGFGVWRTGILWQGDRDPTTTTPVLYLPIVGGTFVAAAMLGALGAPDWGLPVFGAGFFTWLAIESVVVHRLYTATPLPLALRPTVGIKLAPPTVGCVGYLSVTAGMPDTLAHLMIGFGVLQALVLIRLIPWVAKQPFSPGYWAFSFGITALPTAAVRMVERGETTGPVATLAPYLLGLSTLLIAGFTLGTLRLLVTGKMLPAPAPAKT